MSSAGSGQAGEVDPEPGRASFLCGVRRPRVASRGDFHQERCVSVHRVLDQLPHCETLLISATTQEAAAEKLKAQRKRDEGEERPRTLSVPTLLRSGSIVPPEPVRQKPDRFGGERIGRRVLSHSRRDTGCTGTSRARNHTQDGGHAVQLLCLNLASRRGPVLN